jgi:hypothetical protein
LWLARPAAAVAAATHRRALDGANHVCTVGRGRGLRPQARRWRRVLTLPGRSCVCAAEAKGGAGRGRRRRRAGGGVVRVLGGAVRSRRERGWGVGRCALGGRVCLVVFVAWVVVDWRRGERESCLFLLLCASFSLLIRLADKKNENAHGPGEMPSIPCSSGAAASPPCGRPSMMRSVSLRLSFAPISKERAVGVGVVVVAAAG